LFRLSAFDFERFASLDRGLGVHRNVQWNDGWLVVSQTDVGLVGVGQLHR